MDTVLVEFFYDESNHFTDTCMALANERIPFMVGYALFSADIRILINVYDLKRAKACIVGR